jgi:hypothetical protein
MTGGSALLERYNAAGGVFPHERRASQRATPFDGYFWRFVDRKSDRIAVCLCGVTRGSDEETLTATALHPSGRMLVARTRRAVESKSQFHLSGTDVRASDSGLRLNFFDGSAEFEIRKRTTLGSATLPFLAGQLVPGLGHYWQPMIFGGTARGIVTSASSTERFEDADVYFERTWGGGFPARWWWGHAASFETGDVAVAFAGGSARLASTPISPTALVIRLGDERISLVPPFAKARTRISRNGWHITVTSSRYKVRLAGQPGNQAPIQLPLPRASSAGSRAGARHTLSGAVDLVVSDRRSVLFSGRSERAGLEIGVGTSA